MNTDIFLNLYSGKASLCLVLYNVYLFQKGKYWCICTVDDPEIIC